MSLSRPLAVLALAALLSGSGCDGGGGVTPASGGGPIRAEGACEMKDLARPLRQTLVLIDAKAIQRAADAMEFAQKNVPFRDLVLSIADPDKAIASGTTAARERVTLAVVPSDGSAAEVTFSGCLPGLSADELARATHDRSLVGSAFSSGPAAKLADDAEEFRRQLIGGMVLAAGKADGAPSAQTGPIAGSRFFEGVRASKGLFETRDYVQRLILVSDLSGLSLPGDADVGRRFQAGVDAGRRTAGDLERSELHIIGPAGRPLPDRAFLAGYFLAQDADLASLSAGRVGSSGPVPLRLWRFAGEAAYPSGPQGVDIRIGDDGQGRLASTWVTLLIDPRYAIPLTGRIACGNGASCRITSDNGGFAQRWSGASGDTPRFDRDLPFGGMRNITLQIAGTRLTGRVFDDAVYLGTDQNRNSIAISAETKQ